MNLQDNVYFDKNGHQILEGDLLKVFHFRSFNKNYYMYHVAVMELGEMACKEYCDNKPHYKLSEVANEHRICDNIKILYAKDFETERLKIKPPKNN